MHLAIWKFMLYGMLRYIDWEVVNGISKDCSAVEQNDTIVRRAPKWRWITCLID